jgi:prepilin signal peptidase PulO-like enzyme (type II secretory pathway)
MTLTIIFAFIFGLIYGSFLNVLLWRLPEGRSIGGRSYCRSCQHILAWYDLIPVFSFIFLKGQCRYCQASIHKRYPVVELATGITLGLFFAFRQPIFITETIISVGAILALVSLFFFDLFYLILPDIIIWPAVVIYAVYDFISPQHGLEFFATALLSAGFFAILYGVSSGKKLGFGDVKLALLIGLILGYPFGFMAIVGGVWLGGLVAIGLLVLKKVGLKDALPLGSFLALTTIACLIFYHELLPLTTFLR